MALHGMPRTRAHNVGDTGMSRTTVPAAESNAEHEQARYTWLTPRECGEQAGGVADTTVREWITTGKLRALNVGTKTRPEYRIRPEWLEDFTRRQTVNG